MKTDTNAPSATPAGAPIRLLAAAALAAGLLLPALAGAVPLGLAPAMQTVAIGDAVSVDVVLSGLDGEVVSAYDLDIVYDPGVLTGSWRTLLEWHAEGRLHPHVSQTYPLERAGEAIARLAAREAAGKVVVTVGAG